MERLFPDKQISKNDFSGISYKDSPKEYRKKYACNVRDINNPVMKQVKSSLELTRYPVYQECFDRE